METELDRRELIHAWPMSDEDFMKAIDSTGGWPVGFTHVSFFHGVETSQRTCKFTICELRTEWWTTVYTSDDYYWWKLSAKKKKEVEITARDRVIRELQYGK